MAFRVRVKNFQSIEDAEIVVDGFVVICGPNNSGKTALMRAIRGLFTNAAPGSYLRHGANFLSVEIEFDDGTNILWEKGWEKPNQKGAAINRYSINGYQISSVGRGVPPEIEALGVRSILAGNNPSWPQIADQFDGTLFLVNKTGAVVAEALSDVERVGKLTDALRLSDKDKRAANSELKVRRDDIKALQDEVSRYSGFDAVVSKVEVLADIREAAKEKSRELSEAQSFGSRLSLARSVWDELKDFQADVPSEPTGIRSYAGKIKELRSLSQRMTSAKSVEESLSGFSPVSVDTTEVREAKARYVEARDTHQRLLELESQTQNLRDFVSPTFSDTTKVEKLKRALAVVREYRDKVQKFEGEISRYGKDQVEASRLSEENEETVKELLGERGYCPTCKTVHTDPH